MGRGDWLVAPSLCVDHWTVTDEFYDDCIPLVYKLMIASVQAFGGKNFSLKD